MEPALQALRAGQDLGGCGLGAVPQGRPDPGRLLTPCWSRWRPASPGATEPPLGRALAPYPQIDGEDRTMSLSTTTAPPAHIDPAGPPRPGAARIRLGRFDLQGLAVSLRRAVLHRVRDLRRVPDVQDALHVLYDWDLVNERSNGHTFVGLANYVRMFGDDYFWNALRNTFGIFLLATIPQILLGAAPREHAQPAAAGADVPSDGGPDPERHLGRRGRHHLRHALPARLRRLQLGTRAGRARADRLARHRAGHIGRPSRRWSTGAGPATTR